MSALGVIDGVDVICHGRLIVAPGSVGRNATTGDIIEYKPLGNIDNVV